MCNVRILLLLLLGCYGAAAAAEDFLDPPGRVARLSFIDGAVSIAPPGSDQWGEALLNRPLTTGDRIWADAGGRAELEVGSATLRIDEYTGLSFDNLTDDVMQMQLASGVMTVHVGSLGAGQVVEVATPNATVNLLQRGDYTIETTQSGDQTIVKTRSGEATVAGSSQQAYGVATNEQGIFSGTNDFTSEITGIEPRSRFEEWAYAREVRDQESISARYVSREVIGYRDLDTYGTWYSEPEYGHVWRPTLLVADWAPYRYGRWIWVAPWGWTWVDDAPWGFAPSHYGRWAYIRNRWCWVPGPAHIRPVYAPALVGWVGDPFQSPGYIGQVGWFPLAPREAYLPRYRTSWRHFHNVNVSNTVIVNNTYINNVYRGRAAPIDYHNRRVPHALTVVPRDDFVSARRIADHRQHVSDDQARKWPVQGRAPTITPNHDSMIGTRVDSPRSAPHSDHWVNSKRTAITSAQDERAAFARQPRDNASPPTASRPAPLAQAAPTTDRQDRTDQRASADRPNRASRNVTRMPTDTGAQNAVRAQNDRPQPTNRTPTDSPRGAPRPQRNPPAAAPNVTLPAPAPEREHAPPAPVSQRAAMGTSKGRQDSHDKRQAQPRSQGPVDRMRPGDQPQQP
jgi:hypothetical protein